MTDTLEISTPTREVFANKRETDEVWKALKEDTYWGKPFKAFKGWQPPISVINKMEHWEYEQIVWSLAQKRVALPGGLYWFAVHVMGFYRLLPEIHGRILCDQLETILDTPARIFHEWHRASYKTTVVSMAWPCWIMGVHPEQEIMLAQATLHKAKKTLGSILRACDKNRKLKSIFPKLRPAIYSHSKKPQKWALDGMLTEASLDAAEGEGFSRDFTLGICAVDGSSAGDHPTVLIVDDLEDERNTKYPSDVEKTKEVFTQLLGPVLQNECPCVVIGTPWAVNDLHHELRNGERGKWTYFRVPIKVQDTEDPEKWYYPIDNVAIQKQMKGWGKKVRGGEGFDESVEAQLKRDMTPYDFQAQYMCDPTASKHQKFDPETWMSYEMHGHGTPWWQQDTDNEDSRARWIRHHKIILVTDVAIEDGKTNDFTAMLMWGLDTDGHAWLHDVIYDRIRPHEQRDALFDSKHVRKDGKDTPWWQPRPVEAEAAINMTEEELAHARLWNPSLILGEDYTYGKALIHEMRQESQTRGQKVIIRKVTASQLGPRKSDRILKALEPLYRARRLHYPQFLTKMSRDQGRQVNMCKYLYDEFIHFLLPGAHDDGLDATHLMRPYFAKAFRPTPTAIASPDEKIPLKDKSLGLEWKEPKEDERRAPFFEPEPYAVPNALRRRQGDPFRVARSR